MTLIYLDQVRYIYMSFVIFLGEFWNISKMCDKSGWYLKYFGDNKSKSGNKNKQIEIKRNQIIKIRKWTNVLTLSNFVCYFNQTCIYMFDTSEGW